MRHGEAGAAYGQLSASVRKVDAVFEMLRAEFIDGRHRPGAGLSVRKLCERYGVSKQPVMRALIRMEEAGFVEIVPQVGVHVVNPSQRDVEDFYLVFGVMEGTVAGLAAQRRTPRDVERIRAAIDVMTGASRAAELSVAEYRDMYRSLYGAIHEAAASPVATKFSRAAWDRSDFFLAVYGALVPIDAEAVHQGNLRLIEAIEKGDVQTSREEAESQVVIAKSRVIEAIQAVASP